MATLRVRRRQPPTTECIVQMGRGKPLEVLHDLALNLEVLFVSHDCFWVTAGESVEAAFPGGARRGYWATPIGARAILVDGLRINPVD